MTFESSPLHKLLMLGGVLFSWFFLIVCMVSPSPSPPTNSPFVVYSCALFWVLGGFYQLWSTLKSKAQVDAEGIWQSNGFLQQKLCWNDVAAYYLESKKVRSSETYCQPVLLGADGTVLWRGLPNSLGATFAQRETGRAMCTFIESQLTGKEIESPFLHAAFWIPMGPDVEWTQQNLLWKIKHCLTWSAYLALWAYLWPTPSRALYQYHSLHRTGQNDLCLLYLMAILYAPLLLLAPLIFLRRRQVLRNLLPFRFVTPPT